MRFIQKVSWLSIAILELEACPNSLHAQSVTDHTLERGMKPYGTFEGGNIDSTNMNNGDGANDSNCP